MSRSRTEHVCSECGLHHPKWAGQCAGCKSWATLCEVSVIKEVVGAPVTGWTSGAATPFDQVAANADPVQATGVAELDRALGGGLVPGSVTLLGGEPGIGKSTLLLQLAAAVSAQGKRVLYVSAEESSTQLRRRADRLDLDLANVWVLSETSLPKVLAEVDGLKPAVLLVDSIQTVAAPHIASVPGSVGQVRECAQMLLDAAKASSIATVLVGHVTKEGTLAGPRTLEHLVDTVLTFEGDRHQGLRFLRADKHRFGPTGEPGVLIMTATGLEGVVDPSGVFLKDRLPGTAGSAVVPVVDGHRPLLVEVQALVVPSRATNPRRAVQGIDTSRLAMILAVLERRCTVPVLDSEVYASVVGGVRVTEPGADLGLALAVASSVLNLAVDEGVVVFGEVGLAGELRRVSQLDRRLDESSRLGYSAAIVPASVEAADPPIKLLRATCVQDALRLAGINGPAHVRLAG